jgi:hypothetical protein
VRGNGAAVRRIQIMHNIITTLHTNKYSNDKYNTYLQLLEFRTIEGAGGSEHKSGNVRRHFEFPHAQWVAARGAR